MRQCNFEWPLEPGCGWLFLFSSPTPRRLGAGEGRGRGRGQGAGSKTQLGVGGLVERGRRIGSLCAIEVEGLKRPPTHSRWAAYALSLGF